jgi:hypothetical protein
MKSNKSADFDVKRDGLEEFWPDDSLVAKNAPGESACRFAKSLSDYLLSAATENELTTLSILGHFTAVVGLFPAAMLRS